MLTAITRMLLLAFWIVTVSRPLYWGFIFPSDKKKTEEKFSGALISRESWPGLRFTIVFVRRVVVSPGWSKTFLKDRSFTLYSMFGTQPTGAPDVWIPQSFIPTKTSTFPHFLANLQCVQISPSTAMHWRKLAAKRIGTVHCSQRVFCSKSQN